MSVLFKRFRNFRKRQEGSASVEFVLLFPVFMFVFLTGFESGFYMVRHVMLERAVDIAVRDVRLGNTQNIPGQAPNLATLKQRICDEASIFPNCADAVQVELRPVAIAPNGVDVMTQDILCIDSSADDDVPQTTYYDTGEDNSLMVVRVCALSEPLFPTTRLGAGMAVDAEGNHALISVNAFVNEPNNRIRSIETTATEVGS